MKNKTFTILGIFLFSCFVVGLSCTHYINKLEDNSNLATGELEQDMNEDIPQEEYEEEENLEQPKEKEIENNSSNVEVETPPISSEQKRGETSIVKNNTVESPPSKQESGSSGVVDSNGNNQSVENVTSINPEPWITLGISKEDYYTKPSNPWARVDYKLEEYGSLANCEAECLKKSNELAFTEITSCVQVYSHSGDYLGEMLQRH